MTPVENPTPPRILAIRDVLGDSLTVFLTVRNQALMLLLLAVILPELVFAVIFAEYGIAQVQALPQLFTSLGGGPSNISLLLTPIMDLAGYYGTVSLVLWFFTIGCYFSILLMCYNARRGVPLESLAATYKQGLSLSLRKGLGLLLLTVFVTMTMQILPAAAIFVGTLGLMTPVLIVAEERGVWSAFWHSLKVGYSAESRYRGWPTIVSLLAIGAGFYALVLGLVYLAEYTFVLHHWFPLPRTGPLHSFGDKPYGLLYFMSLGLELLAAGCMTLFLPAITVTIYGKVTDPEISVKA